MATRDGRITVTVRGAKEVERALAKLPDQAKAETRRGLRSLAGRFTQLIRAAARTESKQARRVAPTVRSHVQGLGIEVSAGPHPLLFLSEFGMNRRTGWYANIRRRPGQQRQAPRHLDGGSYWFFQTVDEHRDEIDRRAQEIAERIVERWSA